MYRTTTMQHLAAAAFLLLPLLPLVSSAGGASVRTVTVHAKRNTTTHQLTATFERNALSSSGTSQGRFSPGALSKSNFGSLSITTSKEADDAMQMYALGFAEGVLTAPEIAEEIENIRWPILVHYGKLPSTNPADFPQLTHWLDVNEKWTAEMVSKHSAASAFWRAQGLITKQFEGLLAGVHAAAPELKITKWDLQLLNGVGDLFDLIPATTPSARRDFDAYTNAELTSFLFDAGRCSALIKILPDYSNVYFSHSSWWSYNSMIRFMKHYETPLHDAAIKAHKVSFSSYPGMLESLDDFYMMDSGLAMLQTTNSLMNQTLYDVNNNTSPTTSVLAWQRVRIASLLASSGPEWHKQMGTLNSGTYENQYMVIDFNLYKPNEPLVDAVLTIGEQVRASLLVLVLVLVSSSYHRLTPLFFPFPQTPGLYEWTDQSTTLSRGYWPSYNVPFHKATYDRSGYPALVKRLGPSHSYELAPRATIFRRDEATVVDMTTFQKIMRYNDYKNDPLSKGNPDNAICARGDLRTEAQGGATPGGCLDTKTSDYLTGFESLTTHVVNGPTSVASSNGPGQTPFRWSQFGAANKNNSRVGQLEEFATEWDTVTPDWPTW